MENIITIDLNGQPNPELVNTAVGMASPDYKERFRAEYVQLRNRYEGLRRMLDKWDNNTLTFKPTCNRGLYDQQIRAMRDYLIILETRAQIENVDL